MLTITGVLLLLGHPVTPALAAMLLVTALTSRGSRWLSMNAFIAAGGTPIEPGEPITWSVVVAISSA